MALFNINNLTPEEAKGLLSNIDGITPAIAEKISLYMRETGLFKDIDELRAKLKEFGLQQRYLKGISEAISVDEAEYFDSRTFIDECRLMNQQTRRHVQ